MVELQVKQSKNELLKKEWRSLLRKAGQNMPFVMALYVVIFEEKLEVLSYEMKHATPQLLVEVDKIELINRLLAFHLPILLPIPILLIREMGRHVASTLSQAGSALRQ